MNFMVNDEANDVELVSIQQRKTMYSQQLSRKADIQKAKQGINLKLSDITATQINNSITKKNRYMSWNQKNANTDTSSTYQKKVSIRLPVLNNFIRKTSQKQKIKIVDKLSFILSQHDFPKH